MQLPLQPSLCHLEGAWIFHIVIGRRHHVHSGRLAAEARQKLAEL